VPWPSTRSASSPRALLSSEVIGAILVTVLSIVIFATLIFSHGPEGQTVNIHFLTIPTGSGAGTASGAARIMFAQARDATGKKTGLAGLSKHGAPALALVVVFVIIFFNVVGQQLAGTTVINATFYALQIGTVLLLVAYVLATIGAIRFLFFAGEPKEPRWQVVIPVLGCALVLYTIYRNVLIGQEGTYAHLPWIELVYLIVGLGVVVVAPGLAGRVRVGLAASEAA